MLTSLSSASSNLDSNHSRRRRDGSCERNGDQWVVVCIDIRTLVEHHLCRADLFVFNQMNLVATCPFRFYSPEMVEERNEGSGSIVPS
jgi:hypothetical protein